MCVEVCERACVAARVCACVCACACERAVVCVVCANVKVCSSGVKHRFHHHRSITTDHRLMMMIQKDKDDKGRTNIFDDPQKVIRGAKAAAAGWATSWGGVAAGYAAG